MFVYFEYVFFSRFMKMPLIIRKNIKIIFKNKYCTYGIKFGVKINFF